MISELNVNQLRDDIDDINDLLMYMQDIFDLGIPDLTIALANSLLYYAYYPSAIGSLGCVTKNPDINSYSASVFFLTQTFKCISEPLLLDALACALFMPSIPKDFAKWIDNTVRPPSSYSKTYVAKAGYQDLARYAEDNISKVNIEGFISVRLPFLSQLQQDYQALKEMREEEEIDDTLDNSDKYQREALELALRRLKFGDLAKIKYNHLTLSIALGKPTGVWERETDYAYLSPTDYSEAILNAIYQGNYKEFVKDEEFVTNKYSKTLLNFLRSKDDSLLLLIGSFLHTCILSDRIDPGILYESSLYPIGSKSKIQVLDSLNQSLETGPFNNFCSINTEEAKYDIGYPKRDKSEYDK